jgi:hypothetical protein
VLEEAACSEEESARLWRDDGHMTGGGPQCAAFGDNVVEGASAASEGHDVGSRIPTRGG